MWCFLYLLFIPRICGPSILHMFIYHWFLGGHIISTHPQQGLLSTNSLFEFWNSYLSLSNFHYWGTLLAAIVWVFWSERNKRVFTSSTPSRVANLYFLALHLFKLWTGSSSMLEHVLIKDMDRVAPSSAPLAPLQAAGISS
jgi:hypothetical protein